ncbi:MAG: sulfatase [Akkermansiaceae bacterium]|nr:sulfatase [Akkermansiaceae bacterium]MCP5543794.1 sulfatase [Akkermansiaceae bacterium]MCP5546537.1 sulfatase [Akkermansiaceae bacterium]
MIRILILLGCLAPLLSAAPKPNILFFLVDDMGWQETSVPFGPETTPLNRDYRTPNMERLAGDGVLFTNAYACAICSPTRVSLMTGMNAARHGVTCWTLRKDTSPERNDKQFDACEWPLNGLQPPGSKVPRSVEANTLPHHLREAGYRTIHVGKAHFGAKDTPGADPKNLGFDVNIAGSYMGGPGSYHGDKNFSAAWRGGGRIWDVPGLDKYHGQEINLTEALTREAIAELERTVKAGDQPFYLYMSHYTVHAPWEPDRRFIDSYKGKKRFPGQKATLASMVESMDHSLGDLLDALDRLGVADDTIVVFMSDNGSPSQCPRNLPLRGHKISGYEGGNRVPMIVHIPGATKGTKRCDAPVVIEDVFPTFLQWAGVQDIPDNDGVSFDGMVRDPSAPRGDRPLFWHYPNFYDQPPFSSVRLGDLKLIYWHVDRRIELFDLRNDLSETKNLAAERPDDVKRLARLLCDHLRKSKALMPVEKSTGKPVPLPDEV